MMAVRAAVAKVARSTGKLRDMSASSGKVKGGMRAIRPCNPAHANRQPALAPANASSKLSIRKGERLRNRPAPSVVRMAALSRARSLWQAAGWRHWRKQSAAEVPTAASSV